MALQRQFNQAADQAGVVQAAGLPQLRIHTDVGKTWQRIDFVDDNFVLFRQENINAGHAAAAQRLVGLNGNIANFIVDIAGNGRRNHHFRP